jgi:hypothetical protein
MKIASPPHNIKCKVTSPKEKVKFFWNRTAGVFKPFWDDSIQNFVF